MKIVLTGANGNLGQHIRANSKFDIYNVGRDDWSSLNSLGQAEYHALIHCAYDLKTNFNEDPESVLNSNIVSTANALKLCKEKKIPKFIFISSCSVYGDSSNSSEDKHCFPVSLNGHTKLFNEQIVKNFCEENSLNYLILRVFNSYGGYDTFSVIQKIISCAKNNLPFRLVNNGSSERDFIHVNDVSNLILRLTEMDLIREVINLGSGKSIKIIEIFNAVESRFGAIEKINICHENEAEYSRANINKLNKLLEFKPLDIFEYIKTSI